MLPTLSVFLAGLGVGLLCSKVASPSTNFLLAGGAASLLVSTTEAPCEAADKGSATAQQLSPLVVQKSSSLQVHLCDENPYRASLEVGHTFETAERKAQAWMANKTNIRDDLYWKYYGKHTHGKFDVFETMAPCKYSCTGACRADTSKIVCGAEQLQPGCIIYSIGGNNNWEFEQRIYDMTPCEIHTFDCTGPRGRFQPPPRISDRHHFHHVCLATQSVPPVPDPTKVKHIPPDFEVVGAMETLEGMQKRLGHKRLDLLKLDIEGFEWPIFESWPELSNLEASSQVALPMQILVEIHYRTAMHALWPQKGVIFKNEIDLVNLQEHLLKMGYVVAVRDDNEMCKHCTELTLLRHKCVS